ncbi:unnamed protein product [Angiostrongylus costaricensis]|uniref:GST C-terminal domain-containing protein n=1 Tax=Angiostrongylus costaricensis TaxID=334426 RepID=A0A0R3Q2H6_ANGCS|nr:unnamed protein product [Angiostrongylus costaricensis]
MELHVWPADFGLPSIDVGCLQFLMSSFCSNPVSVAYSVSPWHSPTGEYPAVFDKKRQGKVVTDFDKFVEMLRNSGQEVVIDAELTSSERSQIDAFSCFLQQYLHPAVVTFHSDTPLVFVSSFIPVQSVLSGKTWIASNLTRDFTLNMLSAKLGDNKFFCGNKPSSLDALVFGYLAPLLRLPLPNDRLQLHLRACPNLVRFVEQVASIYLPPTEEQLRLQKADRKMWEMRLQKAEKAKEAEKVATAEASQVQEDLPLRDAILFGLGAITLSLVFAIHSGIIQVVVEDEEQTIPE